MFSVKGTIWFPDTGMIQLADVFKSWALCCPRANPITSSKPKDSGKVDHPSKKVISIGTLQKSDLKNDTIFS
jgi:hypothetical protein